MHVRLMLLLLIVVMMMALPNDYYYYSDLGSFFSFSPFFGWKRLVMGMRMGRRMMLSSSLLLLLLFWDNRSSTEIAM